MLNLLISLNMIHFHKIETSLHISAHILCSLSISFSLSIFLSACLSLSLSPSLFLPLSLHLSFTLSLYLSLSVSLSASLCLCSASLSLSFSFSITLSLVEVEQVQLKEAALFWRDRRKQLVIEGKLRLVYLAHWRSPCIEMYRLYYRLRQPCYIEVWRFHFNYRIPYTIWGCLIRRNIVIFKLKGFGHWYFFRKLRDKISFFGGSVKLFFTFE